MVVGAGSTLEKIVFAINLRVVLQNESLSRKQGKDLSFSNDPSIWSAGIKAGQKDGGVSF